MTGGKPVVIRSVYESQSELLEGVKSLYCPDGFDADITYGSGVFYRGADAPRYRFDIDPQCAGVVAADSRNLPIASGSFNSVVFDPPFLTYVRSGRTGNGNMVLARRFSGYWRYDELEEHYRKTLIEVSRVLRVGGVLIFKCQDIVHNHRLHPTHISAVGWAATSGLTLQDIFILSARHRMPSPNRAGVQKHARIHHSYFLILRRGKE